MDSYPSSGPSKFVELLNSQQTVSFGNYEDSVQLSSSQLPFLGSEGTDASNYEGDTATAPKERRKWTQSEDILLISAWLNTSKDPVVGNEQRRGAFWSRVAAYFQASAGDDGSDQRQSRHCKQRWHRINDLVSKFAGAYEAATRKLSSGQSEDDVLKEAHKIFENDQKKTFSLEHAWLELRYDQKWCSLGTARKAVSSRKRTCEEGAETESSQAEGLKRPQGVKAAKASGKKKVQVDNNLNKFETMWAIKKADLEAKERVSLLEERSSKMKLLQSLLAKGDRVAEHEESLKKKLIADLLVE